MEKQGVFYAVSVGPGDPELLTRQACRVLGACDVIAAPRTKAGRMLALGIAAGAVDMQGKTILPLDFTMARNEAVREDSYRAAAAAIKAELSVGRDVAMVNLGDVSVYATAYYILERIRADGFETVMCPGVTSFCAVAARLGRSLTRMDEPLHILPGSTDLNNALALPGTKVVMKSGKAIHETAEEAIAETEQQLNCYADFCRDALAMPVVKGRKTDKEKFAGAEATYTIEAMMKDRKALQSGTSHYFGDKFSRAYDVTFTGRDNKLQYPFQTSWGSTTRLIGACIMTHSDNNGLVLPPAVAPVQVVVVPIAQHKPGVLDAANALKSRLEALDLRVKLDDSEQSPGWKFAQYEMKGVPLRVEIGPKDMEKQQCCIARRDTGEKTFVPLSGLESAVQQLLRDVHDNLYAMAEKNLEDNTFDLTTWEEVRDMAQGRGGFARTKWCGSLECELAMKEKAGVSSRCMPLKQSGTVGKCPVCGKECTTDIYWGVAY